jgi:RimJ/RimL family protein N-acetyltransferase
MDETSVPPDAPVLENDVVRLRRVRDDDADAMTAGLGDISTSRWMGSIPHPYPHEESLKWIADAPAAWKRNVFFFAIADASSDGFLGEAGLIGYDAANARAEMSYWVMPDARGKGVARNAATLLAQWGFEVLQLARIDWAAVVGNDASRAVAEAVGFQYEGLRRSWLRRQYDDSRHDAWVMGLLRDEFTAR